MVRTIAQMGDNVHMVGSTGLRKSRLLIFVFFVKYDVVAKESPS